MKKIIIDGIEYELKQVGATPLLRGPCTSALATPSTAISSIAMVLSVCGLHKSH
jgi:hypothetical protein